MEVATCAAPEDLTDTLDHAAALMSAASAEALRAVVSYDERALWRADGATSMSSWLAARYGLAWSTAREWVRVAHALSELPGIAEAYSRGRLSWDQLRPLTRFATPETDERWAERAPALRPWTLWREARRHERLRREEEDRAHRMRYLSLRWDHELPVLYLEGMLPAEQGTVVQAALERRAQEVVLDDRPPGSPQEARLADALVELVTESGPGQAPPATLVVHADADVVTGEAGSDRARLAETESGQRVTTEAIRRLACDARIEWVLEFSGRPWASGGGAGRFAAPSPGFCATATAPAGSPDASEGDG